MIEVLLADDHALVRRGFRRLLEDEDDIHVVGEAGDGHSAVSMAQSLKPKVVVMDYAMPVMDGVQATREIRRTAPETAVLMLSMHDDQRYIREALDAGALGYMLKNAIEVDLAAAVRLVAKGKTVGVPKPPAEQDDAYETLTQRERQILGLIAQGKPAKEIAYLLNLSVNTVSVHRANLMGRLGIHRTPELVLYAIKKGLVSPS
ncbi:MAG TPA: response regulator transcription factor [Bryobacteraceae bacterium]|nr:response regulator transcription factor [Bryobacteraceae bacterium]